MQPTDSSKNERLASNLAELLTAIDASPNLKVCGHALRDGIAIATVALDTGPFDRGLGGLAVHPQEIIQLAIDERFPDSLGQAWVEHLRWLGFPHLLLGQQLCLYLDAQSEWDPSAGSTGFLNRVVDWFRQAIAGKFEAATALYHPVGGIPYESPGAATLVVRQPLMYINDTPSVETRRIPFDQRTERRIDVVAWRRDPKVAQSHLGVLVVLKDMIQLRLLRRLSTITQEIRQQGTRNDRRRFIKKLNQVVQTLGPGQPLHIIIAVPNPVRPGEAGLHLLAAEIPHEDIPRALHAAQETRLSQPASDTPEPNITWLHVDDTRTSLHTRRDSGRPMTSYSGKNVELWGCGALGSWAAELLVRAGVASIKLSDPGRVTTGLLVRQNYREDDVGRSKAEALAERLRSINDAVRIEVLARPASFDLDSSTDLVIDVTVNTVVARHLYARQHGGLISCPVMQIATDNESSSLGIATIWHPASAATTDEVDDALREKCESDPILSVFATFWNQAEQPPLTPTPGCSIPTFRGSGADATAVAATALNLLATPFARRSTGGFVFGLNHSGEASGALASVCLE